MSNCCIAKNLFLKNKKRISNKTQIIKNHEKLFNWHTN